MRIFGNRASGSSSESQVAPAAIQKELSPGASQLFVFFGGIRGGINMPPFEFYKSAKILDEHTIFVRDLRQCYYQTGLVGVSRDIPSTAAFLRTEIESLSPSRVVLVGNSMGGFAAILFAGLIPGAEAIAFSPRTSFAPLLPLSHRDRQYWKLHLKVFLLSAFKMHVWDLKPLLRRTETPPKVSLYYAEDHVLDTIHANRLADLPSVRRFPFPEGGHSLVKRIRDDGLLPSVLQGTF